MSIWTGAFWKATAERAVSTAAQSAVLVIAADQFNALTFDWVTLGGFAAGGAALSVLKSLVTNAATGNGPAVASTETLNIPDGTGRRRAETTG